jgi:hypothetical protein
MVRVVVDDERAGVVAEDLEAPVDAEELRQRARRGVRREAELARDRDRREGVADVVLAGDEELEEPEAGDLEGGAAVLVVNIDRCETRSAGVLAGWPGGVSPPALAWPLTRSDSGERYNSFHHEPSRHR